MRGLSAAKSDFSHPAGVAAKADPPRAQRPMDLLIAAAAATIALPVIAVAALLVIVTLRRGPLCREPRVGRGGEMFTLLRLDTSARAADGRRESTVGERFGALLERLGIAAIPSLINVLRGDMSIVGPRPSAVSDTARFTPTEARLLEVRPGLVSPAWGGIRRGKPDDETGEVSEEVGPIGRDRLLELRYIQRRNTLTDIWTLLRAAAVVLLRMVVSVVAFTVHTAPGLAADMAIVAASFSAAYFLRFLDSPRPVAVSAAALSITIASVSAGFAAMNLLFLLHRRAWSYASGVEVLPIALSTVAATTVATTIDVLHPGTSIRILPLSVMGFGSLLSGAGFVLVRYRSRIAPALAMLINPAASTSPQQTRAVVYGAGDVGQLLVRRIRSHVDGRDYKIVGFFDDDSRKHGLTVHGIRVIGGRHALRSFVARERVDVIVIAMGNASGADMREILALAQGTDAQIKVAHDLVHWISDRYSTALLRDMRAEDLIGRQPASLDAKRCHDLVAGKKVLVTGACGSIGSELIRQILPLRPARILAVDINESGLYDLDVETKALSADTDLRVVVADVTNRARMAEVVRGEPPDVIFHVAAYKHVPLMETYPGEAAWTNVWGTWVMVDAASTCGADHFVLVSTDKAVNPSSVMGATKRLAEILAPVAGDSAGPNGGAAPRVTVVRFGNVLGSRGSVIPTFERQIELGAPVTVTHRDMTRYFMHREEAAGLIVEAASLSTKGGVFMLDMGDRLRIDDLARKMIRMRGLRPDIDVPVEYTGLRPGEKLHEELIYAHERRTATDHARIFQITSEELPSFTRDRLMRTIRDFADGKVQRATFEQELVAMAQNLVRDDPQGPSQAVEAVLAGRRRVLRDKPTLKPQPDTVGHPA